jgi:hypothetical protein
MLTDKQRQRWRQTTPSMQLRAIVMALEGHFRNRQDKITTEYEFQECVEEFLEEVKGLYPHLDVGAWLNCDSGGTSCP